ncbi:MAG: hypothetical protein J5829_02825 [Lachnospiraceae bacterium]|nr:hypothetical protein [Lachnospiraceae bacterium]
MSLAEILLLVIGAVIFAAGFIVPEIGSKKEDGPDLQKLREDLDRAVDESVDNARKRINEIVESECSIARDDTERAMEKLSNEKIMAINEYGRTVVDDIEKNHKEVVFLYDMLNEKSADIKNTVRKVDSIKKESRQPEPPASYDRKDFNAIPLPSAKDRPALKAAIATGVGRNSTSAITKHENAVRDERRAAYGVITSSKPREMKNENTDRGYKIPKMFAPGGIRDDEQESGAKEDVNASDLSGKIMELHEEGVSDTEIARKFGIGVGEVRLKIGLMEARQE